MVYDVAMLVSRRIEHVVSRVFGEKGFSVTLFSLPAVFARVLMMRFA